MLACLALNASANPPAKLGARLDVLSGVTLPLPFNAPPTLLILTALSLAGSGAAGFLPTGLLAGGTGAAGLVLAAGRVAPSATGGGGGGARAVAAGGGAWASSLRYAEGAQPWV